jgi:peptide/nickel transport system substrate-binding protein
VAAVTVLAAVLAACGGSSTAGPSTSTASSGSSGGSPDPSGVLTYGADLADTFSNTFDPAQSTNDCSYTEYTAVYDSLLQPGNKSVAPGLAESWQTTPTSITLHLRPGVLFSNGQPVTAAAVQASIEHIATSPLRFSLHDITHVVVVNPSTVTLQLNGPVAGDVLWALTYIDGMVLEPSSIPTASTKPVGAGPFTLSSYHQDSSIDLTANPTYWDKSAYHLGGVDFVQVASGPQEVSALETGTVDMLALDPQEYSAVKDLPGIRVVSAPSADYLLIQLRENRAPFDKPAVRAALEYAVDRAALNDAVFDGLGEPAYQPFPKWSAGFNPTVGDRYTYQPAKARAMLAAAGYPKGLDFTLEVPAGSSTYSRTAEIVQAELAPAGFHVTIQEVNGTDLLTEVYLNGVGDAVLREELGNGPDLANNFEAEYAGVGFGGTHLGTTNATLTPLIDQALTSLSPSVQGPLMQRASAIAMATGTEVPLLFEPSIIAYNQDKIGGTVTPPIGSCRSDLAGIYVKKS